MRLIASLFLALATAGPALAEVTAAQAERAGDTLAVTWTAKGDEPVDVLVAARPDAAPTAWTLASAGDRDGRHDVAAPADGPRAYVFLRTADGRVFPVAERVLPVGSVMNFRDVGGYRTTDGRRVRWGLIYRSASLGHLSAAEADEVEALNIRTIHDLRANAERTREPTNWPGAAKPQIKSADYKMDMGVMAKAFAGGIDETKARATFAQFYPGILDSHRDQFRALFQTLLKADGATLYHCSAGKDRTGVATALVLTALGVPRETVLSDYALSNRYYRAAPSAAGAETNPDMKMFASLPPGVAKVFMGVEPAYLEAVFAEIDRRHGSFDAYLAKDLGVGPAEVARLKAAYLQ